MGKQTIIQQIQPNCDNLYKSIKEAAKTQHKTHRDIVEDTGVPRSTVAKFLSGALPNPSVFYIAALCKYLNLSMDSLFDIEKPEEPETGNTAELQAKLDGAEKQVALLQERSKILESGIKERKPIIYGLAGMCLFLSVSLMAYLIMDVGNKDFGLFRGGSSSTVGVVLIAILSVAVLALVAHIVTARKENQKRTDKNE